MVSWGSKRPVIADDRCDIVGMDVCPHDVKRTTLRGLCCIFLVACKFGYFNLAFANQGAARVWKSECAHAACFVIPTMILRWLAQPNHVVVLATAA
ncbi:hypothetical protein [Paraburkholderia ribeironis]|uniref:hypothetical protein n=1 Tax=Paraburkholderia ribeironis TaxID=1247936 RepID=UPI0011782231|nr:hypothetical protein [Paraburkholderia ribeironis]